MRPTICKNVLRLRPRPFKFGWVSISLCYAKNSVLCPASSAPLSSSNVISWRLCTLCSLKSPHQNRFGKRFRIATYECFWSIIFCMCLWTHGFMMVHPCRAFQAVWPTTNRLNLLPMFKQGISGDFNENHPKHQNRELHKDFLQSFVMKFVYYLHLTSCLISQ